MELSVHFNSSGLKIAGLLYIPDDLPAGHRRAAVVVLHGFGSNKDGGISKAASELFASLGYITLRFDIAWLRPERRPQGQGHLHGAGARYPGSDGLFADPP